MMKKILEVLKNEPRLIEVSKANLVVFVGDTHGDFEASKIVVKNYLKSGNILVFLGDYVDRGPNSRENLDFLLQNKLKYPEQIYLLQGNHEGHRILPFYPADFWENLSSVDYQYYAEIVEKFPLIVVAKNVISLHGALPDLENLKQVNKISLGSEIWKQITWGDFQEVAGKKLDFDSFTGRPQFGKDWFYNLMNRFNKEVLIRAHQPDAPLYLFNNRCLTIFTSSAYRPERNIAIYDFKKEIKDARDLKIVRI